MPDDLKPSALLDYASPRQETAPLELAPLALVLGILAGLFGAVMLYSGIRGIFWLVHDQDGLVRGRVFEIAMFNLIGLFSCGVAARWVRFAAGRPDAVTSKSPADGAAKNPASHERDGFDRV